MIYPSADLGGKTFDIYEIARALGVTDLILFNAFKKIIRRGNGSKTEDEDINEAIQALRRYRKEKGYANPSEVIPLDQGIASDEVPAILQKGETVLTRKQTAEISDRLKGKDDSGAVGEGIS